MPADKRNDNRKLREIMRRIKKYGISSCQHRCWGDLSHVMHSGDIATIVLNRFKVSRDNYFYEKRRETLAAVLRQMEETSNSDMHFRSAVQENISAISEAFSMPPSPASLKSLSTSLYTLVSLVQQDPNSFFAEDYEVLSPIFSNAFDVQDMLYQEAQFAAFRLLECIAGSSAQGALLLTRQSQAIAGITRVLRATSLSLLVREQAASTIKTLATSCPEARLYLYNRGVMAVLCIFIEECISGVIAGTPLQPQLPLLRGATAATLALCQGMDTANRTYLRELMRSMTLICTIALDFSSTCDAITVISLLVSSVGASCKTEGFLSTMHMFEALFTSVAMHPENLENVSIFLSLVETMLSCYGEAFQNVCHSLSILPRIKSALMGSNRSYASPRTICNGGDDEGNIQVDVHFDIRNRLAHLEAMMYASTQNFDEQSTSHVPMHF